MKQHITMMAITAVIGSTNAFALNAEQCEATAKAAQYVAVQRDEGVSELSAALKVRSRFHITNELALHNMVQSVYATPLTPKAIYNNTLRSCQQLLPSSPNGAI